MFSLIIGVMIEFLPRSQTSLFFSRNKSARKRPREGEKARDAFRLSLSRNPSRARSQFLVFLARLLLLCD